MNVSRLAFTTVVLLGSCAAANAAESSGSGAATAEEPEASSGMVAEVVVTARRREESLQSVPLAVSAFNEEGLQQRGVMQVQDLLKSVPSVTLGVTTGRKSAPLVGIRGQRAGDVYMTVDPAVGVYLSEVPLARSYGLGVLGLLDIASVEVVKGPQGTLFGRNTTGGAILITPNAPTHEFEGNAELGVGNLGLKRGSGVLNIPLGDHLAFRAAVARETRDGYLNSHTTFEDAYSEDYVVYRGALKYENGQFSSTINFDGVRTDDSGGAAVIVAVRPGGFADRLPAGTGGLAAANLADRQRSGFYTFSSAQPTFSKVEVFGVSNTTSLDLGSGFTIKNIVGYRDYDSETFSETDGTAASVTDTQQNASGRQLSEELQLQYASTAFDATAGAFYFRERGNDNSFGYFAPGLLSGINRNDADAENKSYSIFAQGTVRPFDAFSLTAGVRRTRDEREMDARNRNTVTGCLMTNTAGVALNPCTRSVDKSFEATTWNLSADYRIMDDHLVYIAARRGYRSGGFNIQAQVAAQFEPFKPETVKDVELGYKGDFVLGNVPLRLNVAGYVSDFSDVQRRVSQCNPFITSRCQLITVLSNAAAAKIKGVELELTLQPIDGLSINGFYTYTDAAYDRWDSFDGSGNPVDLSKNDFGALPRDKSGLTVRYEFELGRQIGSLAVQGSGYTQSSMYLTDINDPLLRQKSYSLFDGRIEWLRAMDKDVTVSAWIKNIADKEYYLFGESQYAGAFGFDSGYIGEPRTFGLNVKVSF